MKYVLVKVSRGIVDDVMFYDDLRMAIYCLSEYVKKMNPEYHDAAVYGKDQPRFDGPPFAPPGTSPCTNAVLESPHPE